VFASIVDGNEWSHRRIGIIMVVQHHAYAEKLNAKASVLSAITSATCRSHRTS
jgi:hypothetical protein